MPKKMYRYYELEVSLLGIKPRIWRRFLLHEKAVFAELHEVIQDACGWSNYHLFAFRETYRSREDIAGIPGDDLWETPVPDARMIRLFSIFDCKKPKKIFYEYDFGDSWDHSVKLRKCVELTEPFKCRLLAGKRSFPSEDCGGIPGYEECLAAFELSKNPDFKHEYFDSEQLVDRLEWMGYWSPEGFDLKETQKNFDK